MPTINKITNWDEEVKRLTLDCPEIERMLTDDDVQIEEESDASEVSCKSQLHHEVEEVHEEVKVSCYSQHKDEVGVHEEVNRVTAHCDVQDPLENENNTNIKEEEWVLGCKGKCIEQKQSKYSSI